MPVGQSPGRGLHGPGVPGQAQQAGPAGGHQEVLRPELARQSEHVLRFFQEARAVNQINHQNIIQIFDFVQEPAGDSSKPDTVYCVMELLNGKSLAEWFQKGELSLRDLVSAIRQACAALDAAHDAGVVHRDIKPDNIMVELRPTGPFTKIVDFGVAKLVVPEERLLDTTSAGTVIGTPMYMAPEQATGAAVDHRADIYALGCVLYEGLSGRPPFQASSFGGLFAQVLRDAAPPLPAATPRGDLVTPALAALVMSCLAKDPSGRPPHDGPLVGGPGRHRQGAAAPGPAGGGPRGDRGGGNLFGGDPGRAGTCGQSWAGAAPGSGRRAGGSGNPPAGAALADRRRAGGPLCRYWNLGPRKRAASSAGPPRGDRAGSIASPVTARVESAPVPSSPSVPPAVVGPEPAPVDVEKRQAVDEKAPASGELAVVSVRGGVPFFATVFLDGARLGNTPLQRSVASGHHRLHLKRDGVPPEDGEMVVRPGETTRIRVEMTQ